jgi:hypothetical protein
MHLHLIAYDLLIPPTHGAAMDTYYLLQSLAMQGVSVQIHVFTDGQPPSSDLFRYAEAVYAYPTRTLSRKLPARYPHMVSARNHPALLERLLQDDWPILFAGLQTTYFLSHPEFERRVKLVRLHRIEWEYHYQRAQQELRYWPRRHYQTESRQLQAFEQTLAYADYLLPISPKDEAYYAEQHEGVYYLPPFHPFEQVSSRSGRGQFCLYHGNLGQPENHEAAMFLVEQIFSHLDLPLIIAGAAPQPALISAINALDHVVLRPNPGEGEMTDLMHHAQVHVLPAFHASGMALKLVNSLYTGRFVLVNPPMVHLTGLEFGTHVARDPQEMQRMIFDLWHQDFTDIDIAQRKAALNGAFSNARNGRRIVDLIRG